MRKVVYCIIFLFIIGLVACSSLAKARMKLVANDCIYQSKEHAAFTAMESIGDTLFVAFREGLIHNPSNKNEYGRITILKRINDRNIDTLVLACDTMDLRDPYLINVNGNLRLYCFFTQRKLPNEGKRYGGSLYSDYIDGRWSELKPVRLPMKSTYVLWKVRQLGDSLYSIGYNMKEGPVLFLSEDGIDWRFVHRISDNGNYTEGDVIVMGKNIIGVLRNEDTEAAPSVVCDQASQNIYFIDRSIASPECLQISDSVILLSGRDYNFDPSRHRLDSIQVALMILDNNLKIKERLVLSRNRLGDKGYPSFCMEKDTILISYYEGLKTHSDIYLAKIVLED